jgi:pyrimidine-nucleoside phosphorylase
VREAVETLHGGGPEDFREHCLVVAGEMLALGGLVPDESAGKSLALETIAAGTAWEKFRQLVMAQGGDVAYVDDPERLPQARLVEPVPAPVAGALARVQTDEIGMTVVALGGGREEVGATIDHAVGLVMHCKVGERVEKGQPLFTVHANDEDRRDEAVRRVLDALTFVDEPVEPLPIFYQRMI